MSPASRSSSPLSNTCDGSRSGSRIGYTPMEWQAITRLIVELRLRALAHDDFGKVHQSPPLHPREAVGNFDMFVARKAEVDEPLAVEQPRRLFQQPNSPPVVLD